MIAYIQGKLNHKEAALVIIDVMGVGYEIRISLQTYSSLNLTSENCKLFTYLKVTEDSHTLYGFYTYEEKHLFLDLISVSGIGPNTALMMLSSLSCVEIKTAIVAEDVRTIQSIKGIGAKTAQRAIIELKDKLKKENFGGVSGQQIQVFGTVSNATRTDALAALTVMGIPKAIAEKSIDAILKKEGHDIKLEELIKLALR